MIAVLTILFVTSGWMLAVFFAWRWSHAAGDRALLLRLLTEHAKHCEGHAP